MWRRRTRWPRLLHNFQPRTPRTPRSNGRAGPRKQTCWTAHAKFGPPPSHANLRPSRVLVLSDSLLLCTFGAQVLLLISSERGQIYSFATPKLQPILVNDSSKQLIEQCLNAPDPAALVEQQQQQQQQAPSMPPSMPAPQHYMAQPGMSQPGMPQHAGYVVAPGQMPMQDPHAAAAMAHAQAAAQAQAAAHAQAAGVHPGGYMMAPDGSMVPNAQMPR